MILNGAHRPFDVCPTHRMPSSQRGPDRITDLGNGVSAEFTALTDHGGDADAVAAVRE